MGTTSSMLRRDARRHFHADVNGNPQEEALETLHDLRMTGQQLLKTFEGGAVMKDPRHWEAKMSALTDHLQDLDADYSTITKHYQRGAIRRRLWKKVVKEKIRLQRELENERRVAREHWEMATLEASFKASAREAKGSLFHPRFENLLLDFWNEDVHRMNEMCNGNGGRRSRSSEESSGNRHAIPVTLAKGCL